MASPVRAVNYSAWAVAQAQNCKRRAPRLVPHRSYRLRRSNRDDRRRLLSAFGDFLESLPARSEAKLLCVRFVCRLTSALLSDSTTGGGGGQAGGEDVETPREVCRWLRALPELLCRWGGEFPENSAAALGTLVEVAKHALPPPQQQQQALAAAETGAAKSGGKSSGKGKAKGKTATAGGALAAGAGGGGGAGGRGGPWAAAASELLRSIEPALLVEFFGGPGFLSLPAPAQMDAISLLYHLPSVPATVMSELATACSEPAALERDMRTFVLEVRGERREGVVGKESMPLGEPEVVGSFEFSCVWLAWSIVRSKPPPLTCSFLEPWTYRDRFMAGVIHGTFEASNQSVPRLQASNRSFLKYLRPGV